MPNVPAAHLGLGLGRPQARGSHSFGLALNNGSLVAWLLVVTAAASVQGLDAVMPPTDPGTTTLPYSTPSTSISPAPATDPSFPSRPSKSRVVIREASASAAPTTSGPTTYIAVPVPTSPPTSSTPTATPPAFVSVGAGFPEPHYENRRCGDGFGGAGDVSSPMCRGATADGRLINVSLDEMEDRCGKDPRCVGFGWRRANSRMAGYFRPVVSSQNENRKN